MEPFGIELAGRVRGTLSANVIQGSSQGASGGPGFQAGILLQGDVGPTSTSSGPIDVRGNLIRRVGQGITVFGVDESTIRGNTLSNVVVGIQLGSAEDGVVRRNDVSSKDAGILGRSIVDGQRDPGQHLLGQRRHLR